MRSSGPAWWWWTLPAPASDRRQRARARRLRVLALPRPDLALTVYTADRLHHVIRLEGSSQQATEEPMVALDQWPFNDFVQNVRVGRPPYTGLSGGPGGSGAVEARGGWEGTMRGWAAGALLLAAVLLLVRALERCLHRKLFKDHGPPDEWTSPNVIATNGEYASGPREDDLPPPYATVTSTEHDSKLAEEPPPPYSACYFENPKDVIPTVHFTRRRNTNAEAGPSNSNDTIDGEVKIEIRGRLQREATVCDECAVNETNGDKSADFTDDSLNNHHDYARPGTSHTVYSI